MWRLKDPKKFASFQEVFKEHMLSSESEAGSTAEEVWAKRKTGLLKTTGEVCGTTCPYQWRRETWWWSDKVEGAIAAKRQARHGMPGRAQRRHTAGPNALRDSKCNMLARLQTRLSWRILTTSPQKFFALPNR